MRVNAATKQATRARILESARTLFGEKGYAQTTTRDVAAAAGIAAGTLFNYFPNKDALAMTLLAEALEASRTTWATRRRTDASLEEDLFAHVAAALRALRPHRRYVGEVLETAMSPFARADVCAEGALVRTSHLECVAEILADHGRAEPGGPSFISIHLYWTLFLGVLAFWSADASENQADSLVVLDESVRLFAASLDAAPASLPSPGPAADRPSD